MEMEKNLVYRYVEWKIFSMEWKKFCSMEYRKIVFLSIACPAEALLPRKNFENLHAVIVLDENFP